MPSKKKQTKKPVRRVPGKPNPFMQNPEHMGELTVRQLVEVVGTDEFPLGLDTRICIGDVEGNLGVNPCIMLTAHKQNDVVLSIDENTGDMGYLEELGQ